MTGTEPALRRPRGRPRSEKATAPMTAARLTGRSSDDGSADPELVEVGGEVARGDLGRRRPGWGVGDLGAIAVAGDQLGGEVARLGTGQQDAADHRVERLRVEAARRLLSESRLPVKRISQRCGFGSEETMRRSFLRVLSATPQDYRARFSA